MMQELRRNSRARTRGSNEASVYVSPGLEVLYLYQLRRYQDTGVGRSEFRNVRKDLPQRQRDTNNALCKGNLVDLLLERHFLGDALLQALISTYAASSAALA